MVPQLADPREEILKSSIATVVLCIQVARKCTMIFVDSINEVG